MCDLRFPTIQKSHSQTTSTYLEHLTNVLGMNRSICEDNSFNSQELYETYSECRAFLRESNTLVSKPLQSKHQHALSAIAF